MPIGKKSSKLRNNSKSILKKFKSERNLKFPKTIKFAPRAKENSPLWTNRRKSKFEFFKDSTSQLSLSLKYKLQELESSRSGFCPDLEMHNKRIHQTITKNKKKLLYLIKSCEDLSQVENKDALIYKKSLSKQGEILRRANKMLKEK